LIILEQVTNPDTYDEFVFAELLDRNENKYSFDLVVKHMMQLTLWGFELKQLMYDQKGLL